MVEALDPLEDADDAPVADLGPSAEYVAFRVDGEEYCINIAAVREIRRWSPATKLPHAPAHVTGVINLRGEVLPVLDFATRGGLSPTKPTERHTIIILDCLGQTIGLLVDSVSDILWIAESALQSMPDTASRAMREVVSGLAVINGRMLRVLHVESLSPKEEMAL